MALETSRQWQAAITAWASSKQAQKLAQSTRQQLVKQLNAFANYQNDKSPWAITKQDANQWLEATTTTPASKYHRKAALRNFYRWAKAQGRVTQNPIDDEQHPLAVSIPIGWQAPLEQFAIWQKAKGHSANTIKKYKEKVRQLANDTGAATPWQLDTNDLAEWIGRHGWSRETSKQARTALRAFYSWSNKTGLMNTNPALDVEPVKTVQALPRPASENAYRQALAKASPRVTLMLRLSAELGLRRSEVAGLHSSDLTPDSTGGYWLDVLGKGDKRRPIPVPNDLATIIRQQPKGWLFPNGKGGHLGAHHVGKLVGKALPENVTMHQLRHRFATRAYQASRDIYAVQHLLGHASPTTTQRYVALDLDRLRDVVNAVAS